MRYLIFISLLILASCGKSLIKQEEDAHQAVKNQLVATFSKQIKVSIQEFKNLTKNSELDYLKQAIPDTLYAYVRPLENEQAFIDFFNFDLTVPDSVEKAIILNHQFFSNYITNVEQEITQLIAIFFTNTNYFSNPTNYSNYLSFSNTFTNLVFTNFAVTNNIGQTNAITNIVLNILSNKVETNFTTTNLDRVFPDSLVSLITNSYPDLKEKFSYLPITVERQKSVWTITTNFTIVTNKPAKKGMIGEIVTNREVVTNIADVNGDLTNVKDVLATIGGEFTIAAKAEGPNVLKVKLELTIISDKTNQLNEQLILREDHLSDGLAGFLKPIRNMILNRPSGDLIIYTYPDKANVYLDGAYIGRSPLYYPVVPGGTHQLAFLKEGYQTVSIELEVLTNLSNAVEVPLSKMEEGGVVTFTATPTNAMVFVDSIYLGNTPLTVSNFVLNTDHRVMMKPLGTNDLKHYYTVFKLTYPQQALRINAPLKQYEGIPMVIQKQAWWAAYISWGITLAITGLNIYSHYQREYYTDLYNNFRYSYYNDRATSYDNLREASFTAGIISAAISAAFTANALNQERIFMGFKMTDQEGAYASLSIKF